MVFRNIYYSQAGTAGGGGGGGSGIQTIDGDSGSVTGSTVTIYANNAAVNCGSTVEFVNSGTTSTLNVTDANQNILIGHLAGNLSTSSPANTGIGYQALAGLTTNTGHNVALGNASLIVLAGGAGGNSALGYSTLNNLTSGHSNTCVGDAAGSNYTSSESDNILISNGGIVGESNVLRIGQSGTGNFQQTTAFIGGIFGNSISSPQMVTINSSDQLGSQAIPSPGATTTWTPGIAFGGATTGITYAAQTGYYSQIGQLVFVSGIITLSSKGSASGRATLIGLPVSFGSHGNIFTSSVTFDSVTLTALYTNLALQGDASTTTAFLNMCGSGQTYALTDDTMYSNSTTLIFTFFYTTD